MAFASTFKNFTRNPTRFVLRKSVRFIRLLESLLPPPVFSLIVWPAAAVWAALEFGKDRKALTAWSRFPPQWRPRRFIYIFRQTIGFAHARLTYLWPDRLTQPRWLERCRLEANYDLQKLLRADRPIIFVSLHFGSFRTLPYWLRAHGIPVTTLVGRPVSPQSAWIDRHSAPADVPVLMWVNEMREIRRSLTGDRRLLILVDVGRGKLVPVPFDNQTFWMATGAVRMAASAGALLVPCLNVEIKGMWSFVIHFGAPVPDEYLQGTPNLQAAASHIFHEMLPVLEKYPAQCRYRMLNCITSSATEAPPQTAVLPYPEPEPT
ncbi:MAG: hypothetical protein ABI233_03865 [Chthoniobacterales bacterium]